jgi:ABC-2 type transport system ATP-binding protein
MIEVDKVSFDYGSFRAVDNISFSIRTGEIVGLLGPNGAGKTTTMRMITGFIDPSAGSIRIDGQNIGESPKESRKKIGYMPESAPLYSDMFVKDYLDYVASIQGEDPETKVPQVASVCGITEVMHKNISELSRGYRQRVGLAHALIHDPEILVLDEPTSGLDPNQIIEVRNLIREIGKTRTVIISTHILSEVEMLCDRVIIISRGKIVADSPTAELRLRFGHRESLRIQVGSCTAGELKKALRLVPGVADVSSTEGEKDLSAALISVSGEEDIRSAVFALVRDRGWVLYEMVLQRNSLEDVFRSLTTGGAEQ